MAEYSTFDKVHIFDPDGREETRKFEVDSKNVVVPNGHPGGADEYARNDDIEIGNTDLATELAWLNATNLTYKNLDESYFVYKPMAGNPEVKKWQIEDKKLLSADRLAEIIVQDRAGDNKVDVPPRNHAYSTDKYGAGSYDNYGHVKLASVTNSAEIDDLKDLKNSTFTIDGAQKAISSQHVLDAGTISLLYQKILKDEASLNTAIDSLEQKSQDFVSEADYQTWVSKTTPQERAGITCYVATSNGGESV